MSLSDKKTKIYFEISERKFLLRIIDILVVFSGIFITQYITDFKFIESNSGFSWSWLVLVIYLSFFGTVFNMYHLPATTELFHSLKNTTLTSFVTFGAFLLTPFITPQLPKYRLQILLFLVAILIPLMLWRVFYLKYFATHRFIKKSFLICRSDDYERLASELENIDPHFKISGFHDPEKQLTKYLSNANENTSLSLIDAVSQSKACEIIVAPNTPLKTIHFDLLTLMESGIVVKDYLYAYEMLSYRIPVDLIENDFYKHYPVNRSSNNKLYKTMVRFGEIIFALVGLILCTVFIIPFILIGNLIGNRGPLFYTQERIGLYGRPFRIIKFRSMVTNAEKSGAVFAQVNDSRITPFGKFLRKSRIDELPQLINVLKGEMSVIGPRPERQYFVDQITNIVSFYPTRHVIKPGLTGWAQINYSYGDSIEDSVEKLKYDLFYIKHRGPLLDLNIIVKTIGTVLFYRGQ